MMFMSLNVECQTEREEEDETSSDNISHDEDIEMEDNCRMPISGCNGLLAEINHLKEELEIARCQICGLEMEKKAFEKRINELKLELGIKRLRKSTSGLPMAQAAQPICKREYTTIHYRELIRPSTGPRCNLRNFLAPHKSRVRETSLAPALYQIKSATARLLCPFRRQVRIRGGQTEETSWWQSVVMVVV